MKYIIMESVYLLLFLIGLSQVQAAPVSDCSNGVVFVADDSDLCRYHWCTGDVTPIEWRCPPGARVPTWFQTTPSDSVIPCTEDHSTDTSCLRCDYNDERPQDSPSLCASSPCADGCTCQDLWDSYYCLCPGNTAAPIETVVRETSFCDPRPCRNGGTCFSQWDDYWCQCPPGYTGKNCEVPFCDPNPCENGGTCTLDATNYHCQCTRCYEGSCCKTRVSDPTCGVSNPPVTTTTTRRTTTTPRTTTTTPPLTTTTRRVCSTCQYGDNCEFTRVDRCECNPCSTGQLCYDSSFPSARECLGADGPYGSQYTLTFSQDSNGGISYKRVYINIAGADLTGSRRVRIYTPDVASGQSCYVNLIVDISLNQPTYYDVPRECLNTETGGVESGKVLRIVELEGKEIVVTVGNMDGDGYLAIPDAYAGQYYISHSYTKSGGNQYITIVALDDNTLVTIQRPDEELFVLPSVTPTSAPTSNTITFTLNSLESVRYTYSNLAGSVIISDGNIHVWSGNADSSSQKTGEQLPNVNRWGPSATQYRYIIVSAGDGSLNTYDDIHVQSAVETSYVLVRMSMTGERQNVTINGNLASSSTTYLGSLRPGEVYELYTSRPVQVSHNLRGRASNGRDYYSAYTLIPPIQSYATSYSFQTHGLRGGVGGSYTYHYVTLVSQRGVPAGNTEELYIYHYNLQTGVNTTYSPSQLGGNWVRIGDFYYVATIRLPAEGIYYLSYASGLSISFGAVYYGLTSSGQGANQISQQPNTAFPLGYDLTALNNIPPPRLCQRCTTGPDCSVRVINTCACNPCNNFADLCTDSSNPSTPRVCEGTPDVTGTPFTLMFMQNRPDSTSRRELEVYVTSASTSRSSRTVRMHTPYLSASDPCYVNVTEDILSFEVSRFNVDKVECFETIGSGTFSNKALRIESEDGADILVYAVNRDQFSADGWIAFPDERAGTEYFTVSYAPAYYGTEFAVINIQDVDVQIDITYTGRATPDLPSTRFTLRPGHVLQVQSEDDLSGTYIKSSLPVNAYSGNIRALVKEVEDPAVGDINSGSRDHLVEQLLSVNKWGKEFHIQPIPNRRFGDQLKVIAKAANTQCVLYRRDPTGTTTQTSFTLGRGDAFTGDIISGSTYRLVSNTGILVMQITKSQERGSNIHDPSMITVPPVEQYTNRYIFNAPYFSGGSGDAKRPYRFRQLLISARDVDRNGIRIVSSGNTSFVSSLGTWTQVPGTSYYNTVVDIPEGTSLILHNDKDVAFMCLFYGYDDRESLGFPIGMKLQLIEDN